VPVAAGRTLRASFDLVAGPDRFHRGRGVLNYHGVTSSGPRPLISTKSVLHIQGQMCTWSNIAISPIDKVREIAFTPVITSRRSMSNFKEWGQ
jgi:hypothetical protein